MVNTGVRTPFAQCIRTVRLLKETHKGLMLPSTGDGPTLFCLRYFCWGKRLYFEPFDGSSILKWSELKIFLWWDNECELLCMGLFSLFKSEYLKHSRQAKQCKKIWAISIKGFGYFIIVYQTGIFGLSHICLLFLRIASHYLVAVPGYLCFTEPFKWLLSLLGMRCLNVLACIDAYWTMILFAGAPKCLAALHLKSH